MRVCPDCGSRFETGLPSCPKCGCPSSACREEGNTAPQPSHYSENQFATHSNIPSDTAESTLITVSNLSLKWGNILAWIGLICCLITAIKGFAIFRLSFWLGLTTVIGSALAGVVIFFIIRLVAKAAWSFGHLYVSMSQTLKRIEANTKH